MTTKSLTTIGRNLRSIRDELHLTQAEVATKAGISVNHYAQLERGEANPSVETLESICKVLGVKSSKILPF